MQIEHALNQPVVVEVTAAIAIIPAAEMEQQVALGTDVVPGLVRHSSEHEGTKPFRRLSLPDIDHPPVVYLGAAGPVSIQAVIEPAADAEGKMAAGEEYPAIVLPESLSFRPQLQVIAIGPEAVQVSGTHLTLEPIEFVDDRICRYQLEIGPVAGRRLGIVQRRSFVVRCIAVGPDLSANRVRASSSSPSARLGPAMR